MDPDTVRSQERALMRGIGICLLAFAAGMGLWAYNYIYHPRLNHLPPPPQHAAIQTPPAPKPAAAPIPAPPAPVIQDVSLPGPRFVHRGGSDVRDRPKTSGHVLKKEVKGAKVTLDALEDGGWAKVTDGNITVWMRASVLGVNPPAQ